MWTRTVVYCAAMALALPTPEDSTERMMQPLSAAASGNYTISFMPLLTVLVNMFPRLMSRVRVQPLTSTTQARKLEALWEWERTSLCTIVETAGWASHENPCQFYSCSFSSEGYCKEQVRGPERKNIDTVLLTSTVMDECTTLEVRRCTDLTHKYNPDLARCEPMDQQDKDQLVCQQSATMP